MPIIEDVFKRVKQRLPQSFRNDVPPRPPVSSGTTGQVSLFDGAAASRRIANEPGFRDPQRNDEDFGLGEPVEISEQLRENGWEAVAWYLPFHMNTSSWGIYIHWRMFKQLASLVVRNVKVPPRIALENVYDELIGHELFHCRTEIFATVAEDITGDRLYLRYGDVYRKIRLKKDCVEESLATSYGLAKVKDKNIRNELGRLSQQLPPSNSQWTLYPYSPPFEKWRDGIEFIATTRQLQT